MSKITKSSAAAYFAKNLQQVGFSSPTKAVLTTLKEAVDNSLDACEEAGILPEIHIKIKKEGRGAAKNTDLIYLMIEDNGPGLEEKNIAKVFGEYLASSKFGQGRCSRGQQGIGISAATTWAQLTNAKGVRTVSKTKRMSQAISALVSMDIKNNKGILKDKKTVPFEKPHGLKVEFFIDGRIQLNGDGGLITYLEGTALVNPHLELKYELLDKPPREIKRASHKAPVIPPAVLPHPHTMKLGEFLQHAGLYGRMSLKKFLKTGFSRVTDKTLKEMEQKGLSPRLLEKPLTSIKEQGRKAVFSILHEIPLPSPSTKSVLIVGEEGLSESIQRMGEVDFFSALTRKPRICDHKSVVVEVAIARLKKTEKKDEEASVQLLRFANRVPLQFDKASCAITKAVESVNWRAYGLAQPKKSLPLGPYVFAVAVTSPFIKFKNASKETIDASGELVEEIRLALIQTGQKLRRHIKKEKRADDLLKKKQYIEKFAPILIRKLKDIAGASEKEIEKAEKGLYSILSQDAAAAEKALEEAEARLKEMKEKLRSREGFSRPEGESSPKGESPPEEGAKGPAPEDGKGGPAAEAAAAAGGGKGRRAGNRRGLEDGRQKELFPLEKKQERKKTPAPRRKPLKRPSSMGKKPLSAKGKTASAGRRRKPALKRGKPPASLKSAAESYKKRGGKKKRK